MADKRPTIDFIFRITNDVLWNTFKKNEIGDVMLPFVVLRRLDCILEPQKQAVRDAYLNFKDKVQPDKLGPILERAAGGLKYYNTSPYDLRALTQDAQNVEINFRAYINGFSPNVTEIMEHYQLDKVVARLVKNNLLYEMVAAIAKVDLHTSAVSNHDMGYVFEELIRKFNEENNEEAGEHFTPREVIDLMTHIIFEPVKDQLPPVMTIYDPACGSGGMLTESQNFIKDEEGMIRATGDVHLYGKEINDETYAICKSDMMIKGNNPENIRVGSTLSTDEFSGMNFNFMLSNPPYGKSWGSEQKYIKDGKDVIDPRFVVKLKDYWGNEE
ncbi:MAG: type I restriction-modification system subunit M, partial [Hymenobacteraceae bacterium]|nr:type I restriction-modification system subunit M [Hymenobacteraceae bacterium]